MESSKCEKDSFNTATSIKLKIKKLDHLTLKINNIAGKDLPKHFSLSITIIAKIIFKIYILNSKNFTIMT